MNNENKLTPIQKAQIAKENRSLKTKHINIKNNDQFIKMTAEFNQIKENLRQAYANEKTKALSELFELSNVKLKDFTPAKLEKEFGMIVSSRVDEGVEHLYLAKIVGKITICEKKIIDKKLNDLLK